MQLHINDMTPETFLAEYWQKKPLVIRQGFKNFEDLLKGLTGISMFQSKEELLKEHIGEESYQLLQQIKRANQLKGIQAMMPFELKIQ